MDRGEIRLGFERVVVAGRHRRIGILEAVAGYGEHYPARTRLPKLEKSGHGGRARGLYKDSLTLGKPSLGRQDVLVGDHANCAVAFRDCGVCACPTRGVADANCGGDRVWGFDDTVMEYGRRTGGLEAHHSRKHRGAPKLVKFTVTLPVGGHVAGVSHREDVEVRGVSKLFDDLERSRLLSLDAVRVDRIDDGDSVESTEFPNKAQSVVEISPHGDHLCAVEVGLDEFSARDLARRQKDRAQNPGTSRIGGRGGGGVAGGSADDRARPSLKRFRNGDCHSAIFEGARRV